MGILSILIIILMLGTVASLIFGVFLMAKGGGVENAKRQNKFMTYRIYFQAGAIVLMLIAFSLAHK